MPARSLPEYVRTQREEGEKQAERSCHQEARCHRCAPNTTPESGASYNLRQLRMAARDRLLQADPDVHAHWADIIADGTRSLVDGHRTSERRQDQIRILD